MHLFFIRRSRALFGASLLGVALATQADGRVQISTPITPASSGEIDAHRLPSHSPNADSIVFASYSSRLVSGDINGFSDVFLWSRPTGNVRLLTIGTNGPANGASFDPVLSKNGKFVAFITTASNMLSDTNKGEDIYVLDVDTGAYDLISVPLRAYTKPWLDVFRFLQISETGRFVACTAVRSELQPSFPGAYQRIVIWDRELRTSFAVSTLEASNVAQRPIRFVGESLWLFSLTNVYSFNLIAKTSHLIGPANVPPGFSPDGTKIALQWATASTNIVRLHDTVSGQTRLLFAGANKLPNYDSVSVADNGKIAFLGYSGTTDRDADVFVVDPANPGEPARVSNVSPPPGVTDYASNPIFLLDGQRVYFRLSTPVALNRPPRTGLYVVFLPTPAPQRIIGGEFLSKLIRTPAGVVAMAESADLGFTTASAYPDLAFIGDAPLFSLEIARVPEGWQISYPKVSEQPSALQFRDQFSAGDWIDLNAAPVESGGRISVTDPAISSERHYRLRLLP